MDDTERQQCGVERDEAFAAFRRFVNSTPNDGSLIGASGITGRQLHIVQNTIADQAIQDVNATRG